MFDAIKKEKPLTEQIADRISQMIIDRHLDIGEQLPNEFELAGDLNVGRGTVREAVKLLVSRNVLIIKRGTGTFVANNPGVVEDPWGFAYIQDQYKLAQDLLEIRFMVEPNVAALAAERATEEDLVEIRELCEEVERMIYRGENHLEKDIEFHTRIARSTQNQIVPKLIPIINYSIGLFGGLTKVSLKNETIALHRSMVEALAAHDSEAARSATYKHISDNKDRLTKLYEESQQKK